MKRLTMLIMAVALTVSITGVAAAQDCPRHPMRRAVRQELRVRQGMQDGQLTRREAYRLRMHQRHIRRMELRARADGRIVMRERIRLNRAHERQNARIWRFRHNHRVI